MSVSSCWIGFFFVNQLKFSHHDGFCVCVIANKRLGTIDHGLSGPWDSVGRELVAVQLFGPSWQEKCKQVLKSVFLQ